VSRLMDREEVDRVWVVVIVIVKPTYSQQSSRNKMKTVYHEFPWLLFRDLTDSMAKRLQLDQMKEQAILSLQWRALVNPHDISFPWETLANSRSIPVGY
jgi:hypothetical protein